LSGLGAPLLCQCLDSSFPENGTAGFGLLVCMLSQLCWKSLYHHDQGSCTLKITFPVD